MKHVLSLRQVSISQLKPKKDYSANHLHAGLLVVVVVVVARSSSVTF